MIHQMNMANFTGDPPYSIPPYCSRCGVVDPLTGGGGTVLVSQRHAQARLRCVRAILRGVVFALGGSCRAILGRPHCQDGA